MQTDTDIKVPVISDLEETVLKALAYSEVFKYPLTISEIAKNAEVQINDPVQLIESLDYLELSGIIFKENGFYSLANRQNLFENRRSLNERAESYMARANKISKFIGKFPYVKAVFLSGSITKNSMEEDGDIDYFVITSPGRLWIARTLLILFKKIFLLNSYKYFCLNYFSDIDHLEIKDQNLYLAHEIKTLIPTYGKEECDQFFEANQWVYKFLPQQKIESFYNVPHSQSKGIKRFLEFVLAGKIGDMLESNFKSITDNYWKKKFQNDEGIDSKNFFVTSENVSALHPENFKSKVLKRYDEILSNLSTQLNHRIK